MLSFSESKVALRRDLYAEVGEFAGLVSVVTRPLTEEVRRACRLMFSGMSDQSPDIQEIRRSWPRFRAEELDRFIRCAESLGYINRIGDRYALVPDRLCPQGLQDGRSSDVLEARPLKFRLDKWIANYEQIGRRLFTAENLIEAVCSGEAQWPSVFGPEVRNCFDLGIADPDLFLLFNQAMYQANLLESHLVAASIESDDVLDVLDVGGGPGAWLDALSSEGVKLGRALNYEFYGTLPVMVKVRDTLGLPRGGFDFIGGNFFEQSDGHAGLFGLDPGDRFDLVSLNWILHDWSDDRCVEILGKVKHHLKPNGFLVVQEALLPPSRLGRNTMGDMMILLQTGGTERTVGDFRRIFDLRNLSVKTVLDFGTRRSVLAVQANH